MPFRRVFCRRGRAPISVCAEPGLPHLPALQMARGSPTVPRVISEVGGSARFGHLFATESDVMRPIPTVDREPAAVHIAGMKLKGIQWGGIIPSARKHEENKHGVYFAQFGCVVGYVRTRHTTLLSRFCSGVSSRTRSSSAEGPVDLPVHNLVFKTRGQMDAPHWSRRCLSR